MNKIVLLFLCCITLISCNKDDFFPIEIHADRTNDFSIWQLEQFFEKSQMGYIIRTDDNNLIVVDGGISVSGMVLERFLAKFGGKVSLWLITHPHNDHAGALTEIIKSGKIQIDQILHTELNELWVQDYEQKSFSFLVGYNSILKKSKIPIMNAIVGFSLELGDGVTLEIFGNRNEDILVNAVNNSSMVFKITSKSKSILFLGDLGEEGGDVILRNISAEKLKSDYVQMAHHGQRGVKKSFYEAVQPDYALWATPLWLWNNDLGGRGTDTGDWKTLEVREWMNELNIKENYVSGLLGTIQID